MSPTIRSIRDELRPSDFDRLCSLLRDGGTAIIPTDTVYGLVGRAFDPKVFDRLDALKGERRLPYAVAFPDYPSLVEWYGRLGIRGARLATTLLPGPVTFILPANDRVPPGFRYANAGIGVRVSSDRFMPELARRLGSPIWATSANYSGQPAPVDFRSISPSLRDEVDMAIDAGPTPFKDASTVIDLRESPPKTGRAGPWLKRVQTAVDRLAEPIRLLTVCSGNTCRSPIAAKLLERSLAGSGFSFECASAGLDAAPDMPASREMINIGLDWGLDLTTHKAQQLDIAMLRKSDYILAASPEYLRRIHQIEPKSRGKVFLMGETSGAETVRDPFEGAAEDFRSVALLLRDAMAEWAKRISHEVSDELGVGSRIGEPELVPVVPN